MNSASFDLEHFIIEISQEESIWNLESKEYHNKIQKYNSWSKVAKATLNDFDSLDETGKREKIIELQKKWKNLRDTYKKKCITKSGQAANKKKKYVFSEILEFLRPTMENRRTEGNFNRESDEEETEDDLGKENSQMVEEDLTEVNSVNDEPTDSNSVLEKSTPSTTVRANLKPTPKRTKQSKKINFEDELLKSLRRENEDTDPDKLFLMSLLPQMKSISEDKKPMLYIELINTIQRVKNPTIDNTTMYRQVYNQGNFPLGGYSQTASSGPSIYPISSQPVLHPSLPNYIHDQLQPSYSGTANNYIE